MKIEISDIIRQKCPNLNLGIIEGDVENSPTNDDLWQLMISEIQTIKSSLLLEEINKREEIKATRMAYKSLGKDPNRYRPSAEALCRRIVKDTEIYRTNALVDIINIMSINSGISIGAFDKEKIQGSLILDVGKKDELFEAIGRGILNIDGLPVYRDAYGGIGTPTSDNVRTKISPDTEKILIIFNCYTGSETLTTHLDHCIKLLQSFSNLQNYKIEILKVKG